MRKMFVLLVAMLVVPSVTRAAGGCTGNACSVLRLSANGNCHTITNVGSRTITVRWGVFGPMILAPHQSHTITNPFGGGCVGVIVGDLTANY
jgi:hypothetical protein